MSDGVVVWITGLPASGKSTLATRLAEAVIADGRACVVLDGDAVRAALVPSPGYGPAERRDFYVTLGNLASLIARQGLVVVVPATASRRAFREHARHSAPRFVEVHVAAPLAECAKRDFKGLYERAAAGEAPTLPGLGVDYEPPQNPDVVATGGRDQDAISRTLGVIARVAAGATGQ